MSKFYLGTCQVDWLARTPHPLMVSYGRLRHRKTLPLARCEWIQDSRGFTELRQHGRWTFTAQEYASATETHRTEIGGMTAASVRDWMCEPSIIAKTGLSVAEHQQRTIDSYFELRALAPNMPWLPVLQGWTRADYLAHVEQYDKSGLDLRTLPLVGLGSVCRRQHTREVEELIRELHGYGLRLHGFGFKIQGLARVSDALTSSDSMAWSFDARRGRPLPDCRHGQDGQGKCSNCLRYALQWRLKALGMIAQPSQPHLFTQQRAA